MRVNQFIEAIEKYYTVYDNNFRKMSIIKYLYENYKYEDELEVLYNETIKQFSSKWKNAPDISIFEGIRKEYNKLYHYICEEKEIGSKDFKGTKLLEHDKKMIEDK